MGYELLTPPAAEPFTLADLKAQLYIESTFQDDHLTGLITAARTYFEGQTNRRLVSQAWRLSLDGYPRGPIQTPIGPVISVDELKFKDLDGVVTTVDPSAYAVSRSGARAVIVAPPFQPWPWVIAGGPWAHRLWPDAVTVDFTAGYGADAEAIPMDIVQAIKLIAAHWHANRTPVITGVRAQAVEVPMSAQAIIDFYRIPSLG